MKTLLTLASCFVTLISATGITCANNNLFLPGDAFFPTELTLENVQTLKAQQQGPYVFQYSSFGTYGLAFCGNAGYEHVAFESVDAAFINNLANAYTKIRQTQPRILVENKKNGQTSFEEKNGLKVLFYREDFDLDQNAIGLRYNEHWVEDATKFGHQQDHLRLCCLLRSPGAVMVSWRDARRVSAFDLVLPKDTRGAKQPDPFGTAPVAKPVPVQVRGKVKAIIVLRQSLDEYFAAKNGEYLPLHLVTSDRHTEIVREKGKWVVAADDGSNPFGN